MIDKRKVSELKEDLPEALHPFLNLNVDQARGYPSPHKPLLVLMMLMRLKYEGAEKLAYEDISDVLTSMLELINIRPNDVNVVSNPFWRLKQDGIWEVQDLNGVAVEEFDVTNPRGGRQSGRRPVHSKLRKVNPLGSFSKEVRDCLYRTPELIDDIAKAIVATFFEERYGAKLIYQLIGFYENDSSAQLDFNKNVYKAYQSQCSVCRQSKRLFNSLVDLNATPIRPSEARMRNSARSGIALCGLHDLLFRSGLVTMTKKRESYRLEVSTYKPKTYQSRLNRIYRAPRLDLAALKDTSLHIPENRLDQPSRELLAWHNEHVFLG